ncbi:MAG: flavodoxin family protein [Cytophagaceae bacterium]|nr:MAG: flavodoxin family protein [Cytophagaceae bacterium]
MKTLVIVSHPYPEQSHVVKVLQQTVEQLPGFTVRNLESLYGNDPKAFDVVAEQAASDAADRIVFLFPIHWFNLTPMLKAYLNEVWTYGWAFGPEGTALQGKELVVVTTAGAAEQTYSPSGLIRSTMDDVLTPLKASALYVGMDYSRPLAFFSAMGASEQAIAGFQRDFAHRLQA